MEQLRKRWWVPLTAMVLLAGCAGQQTRSALPAGALVCDVTVAPEAISPACAKRIGEVTALAYQGGWTLQGRVAISNGRQGGNARVDWVERGLRDYSVTLSAPVTRQSWRLDVQSGQATISGIDGGPRTGADAAQLLREATTWEIPVEAMRWWLRGQTAPAASATSLPSATRYVFSADGALIGLDQDGWRIEFQRASSQAMPSRITATRGESRVRLVVDEWGSAASG